MLIFYLLCYAALLPIMLNIMLTLFHCADLLCINCYSWLIMQRHLQYTCMTKECKEQLYQELISATQWIVQCNSVGTVQFVEHKRVNKKIKLWVAAIMYIMLKTFLSYALIMLNSLLCSGIIGWSLPVNA